MIIRLAGHKDLEAINDIYNQVIPYEMSTADMVPYTMEERESWFRAYDRSKYPVYVAEEDNMVAGFLYFSPYRPRRLALRFTVEVSYFIHSKFRKKGIGTELMNHAVKQAPEHEFKTLLAILLTHNEASIALLEKFGFKEWGRLPAVADFDGKERDQSFYGLRLAK